MSMPKYSFSRQDVLTPQEVQGMIEAASPELQGLLAFLYLWGARIGEALSMSAEDFTHHRKVLKARIKTEKLRQEGPILGTYRNVPIALSAPFTPYLLGFIDGKQGRLWRMNRVTYWRRIKKLNPLCTAHIFRHTRATRLAEETNDPLALQAFFGWADLRMAMKYIHASGTLSARLAYKVH